MLDLYALFLKLSAYGPSGREGRIAEVIGELAAPYADEIRRDTMGNLIVLKKGTGGGKKIMLSAHMDSTGFAACFIDENGFIRFSPVGGLSLLDVVGAQVIFENGTRGVVAYEEKTPPEKLKLENCFIDIGAADRAEAARLVAPGDFAVFSAPAFTNGRMIFSPYLDNRIGCTVLLAALSLIKDTQNDLYFVFSTQEEVGLRGARTAAYGIDPDIGVAVDVTDSDDTPEKKDRCPMKLGAGPAIKVMDRSVICDYGVVQWLRESAKRAGVPAQTDIISIGGTDAGVIQIARSGVPTGGLSIPCRYIHAPCEAVSIDDVKNAALLLAEALR